MYFIYNGISSEDMGIVVNSMPSFVKPSMKYEAIQIDGKDGAKIVEMGYSPYVLKAKITLLDPDNFDKIYSWLNGSGVLRVSDDINKYRNVKILNDINYQKLIDFKEASIEFYVYDPFRYIYNEIPKTITSFPSTIKNDGTAESKPIITIVGSGVVTITINGTTFEYTFPTGESVVLDCNEMDATYDSLLRNQYLSGNFPSLSVGLNDVNISGSVTSIKFEKHSRYL